MPALTLGRIAASAATQQLATELLVQVGEVASTRQLLEVVMPKVSSLVPARVAAVYRPEAGSWHLRFGSGRGDAPDFSLLAEALDSDHAIVRGNWGAAPLEHRSPYGDCLVLHGDSGMDPSTIDSVAALLGTAIGNVRARQSNARRVRRLEAILEIAGQWNQNLELDSLLAQMAETSTRLLEAERASIFLWDRPHHQLIGRPALGVEGDELRIKDSEGIVSEVVQTGELRRVDASDHAAINRNVDRELGFHTRTVLCAPLKSRNGRVLGAFEMINKREGNFTADDEAGLLELAAHAAIALENTQHFQQLLKSRKQMAQQAADRVHLIGQSAAIEQLRKTISRVASTDLALLVLGENGTGKEVVSQMVHYLSPRHDEPFIAVNCAALTETLLESELFGHEKGAYTDAHEARQGKFELASGGTLFLDEIGDLSPSGQAKLLRVLEEKVVVRVGGSLPIPTDTRVIAATNQSLAEMVKQKRFREDLYFRLNVVTLELPPLRNRVDDIMLLARHFMGDFARKARRAEPTFSDGAIKRLRQHAWPGNVRELRNLMERLAYLTQEDCIDVNDLAFILSPGRDSPSDVSMDLSLADATRQFQASYIQRHIEAAGGNMSDAARRMGLHRSNLYRKMRQLNMSGGEEGSEEESDADDME